MRPANRAATGLRWLALACALAAGAACAAALRHPTASDVERAQRSWPGTTSQDLERGRALYTRRCASCHGLHLPQAYSTEEWPRIVDSMAERARLMPDQARDVKRFLVSVSESPQRETPTDAPPAGGRGGP